jgi:radical SAM protein with 4Fe4S-binding SPASM domain
LENNSCGMETEDLNPSLFSFITLRHERFGALVFNPYLGIEEELDPIEDYIAASCNGHNSWNQIETIVQARFGLSSEDIQKRIKALQNKLSDICALKIRKRKQTPSPLPPDSFFFTEDGPILSAPKSVIWDVTYACNLRCPHCLTDSGKKKSRELTTKEAYFLIDTLSNAKIFSLSLSGGEPLLRPDIEDLLTYLADTNIRVGIATNGVKIAERTLRCLGELPIYQVQVSIDGIDENHDRFRGLKGAFDSACTTIQRLCEIEIGVSISTTVTSENIHELDRIIDFAVKIGCSGFKAIPFLPAGRGRSYAKNLQLDQRGHLMLCKILTEKNRELNGVMNVSTETCHSFLFNPPQKQIQSNGPMGCSAGYDTLSIGADGTAYPCPFLHDFPIGNLLQHPFPFIWRHEPVLQTLRMMEKKHMGEPCGTCNYAPFSCRGGCRAAAYFEYDNLIAADPTCFKSIVN